jgi:hypothetical protein
VGPSATTLLLQLLGVAIVLGPPALAGMRIADALLVRAAWGKGVLILGAPCLLGYLAIAAYLASPRDARIIVIALWICLAAYGGQPLISSSPGRRKLTHNVIVPAVLVLCAAAFNLSLGFMRGEVMGVGGALATAQVRYTGWLPADAKLPYFFALQLLSAHRPLPHYLDGNWLSSDRPPLQTGIYLVVRSLIPYSDGSALLYQVTGTVLQSFWVAALWCLLRVMRVPAAARVCTLIAVLLSGFSIVNSFFVWPKLFPAAFLVLLVAAVARSEWVSSQSRGVCGALFGLAGGLALLGHEGSVIVLAPIALVFLVRSRGRPGLSWVLGAAVTLTVLMTPWFVYQHYYDPPGDNLTELQLAGRMPGPQDQGLVRAVEQAYGDTSAEQLIHNKIANLQTPLSHEPSEIVNLYRVASNLFASSGRGWETRTNAVRVLRNDSFFYVLPSTGTFALGLLLWPALWLRRRKRGIVGVRVASCLWLLLLMNLLFWAALLFSRGATVIHQGSYATDLIFFAAAGASIWYVSRPLLIGLTLLQVGIGLSLYAAFQPPLPGHAPVPGPVSVVDLLISIAALAAFTAVGASTADGEPSVTALWRSPERFRRADRRHLRRQADEEESSRVVDMPDAGHAAPHSSGPLGVARLTRTVSK